MKKIMLFCAGGMSTSVLVKKMRTVAAEDGFECEINAYAVTEAKTRGQDADAVLLGPQIAYELAKTKELLNPVPVEAIEMRTYGMMDGKAVMKQVYRMIEGK